MTTLSFHARDLISINDLERSDILFILDQAERMRQEPNPKMLEGLLLGSCFFEPSTRTRLSFEAAMHRCGGRTIGFADPATTSTRKGETLHDSMKMMESYVDCVVIRHPLEGSAQRAAEAIDIPVINAGDGAHQHPTQTLLDLFTIRECQGRLDGLNIAMVGDLRYGRTVHSLAEACAHFGARLYFVSPPSLEMPKGTCDVLRRQGVPFSFHESVEEVLPKVDILYMTRVQQERFADKLEYERLKNSFRIDRHTMRGAKENLRILHPLPRVEEIAPDLDDSPWAYYFEQARNGLFVRQALLGLLLGRLQ